jgi:hypothetical protein
MYGAYGPLDVIYGMARIAGFWQVSLSTGRRWLQQPEAACFGVGSMDNTGGGYGHAWYGQVNSLAALQELMLDRRSSQAAAAARHRWLKEQCPSCEVSGSSVCSGF